MPLDSSKVMLSAGTTDKQVKRRLPRSFKEKETVQAEKVLFKWFYVINNDIITTFLVVNQ